MKASTPATPVRCHWAQNEWNIAYHDKEWGVPIHDDIAPAAASRHAA